MKTAKYYFTYILFFLLACSSLPSNAQTVQEPKDLSKDWYKPYAPFRIVGNLYYVGTYDLACYLIVTEKGNILINTGLASSAEIINANIKTLGFKLSDTKILLTTQAHYDHVGAMANIKKTSGAKMWANEREAKVMKDGGSSDYALGNGVATYIPVTPDKLLKDGDMITLGTTKLTLLSHPGHTKGSSSYLFETKDEKRTYKVLIANIPTIVTSKRFAEVSGYPEIAKDYAQTLKAMKNLKFDIWVASHASQFNLHEKHKIGAPYNPTVFIDRKGYDETLAEIEQEVVQKNNK